MPADRRPQTDTKRRPRKGGGGGYLVLSVVIVAIAAVCIFASDTLKSALGMKPTPSSLGPEPATTGGMAVNDPASRPTNAQTNFDPKNFAQAPQPTKPVTPQVAPTAPVKPTYSDEARGHELLTIANKHYKALAWSQAQSSARQINGLNVPPALAQRARQIVENAEAITKLFASMNQKDELVRNWDTHPSIVTLQLSGGSSMEAVPLLHGNDPIESVDSDPLVFIDRARKSGSGQIYFMNKGSKDFIKAPTDTDKILGVTAIDVAARSAERRKELDTRFAKVEKDFAGDGVAWYELAKFGYRNRLDDRVAEHLDQALLLDSNLAHTVREEKAALYSGMLTVQLKNGNKPGAASVVGYIRKHFADTDEGKAAIAKYEGDVANMVKLSQAAANQRNLAAQQNQQRLQTLAKQSPGNAAVAAAAKAQAAQIDPPAPTAGPVTPGPTPAGPIVSTGAEADADKLADEGMDMCGRAVDMPAGPARNKLYHDAVPILMQALKIYDSLISSGKGSANVSAKRVDTNKTLFLARKSQTL